MSCKGVRLFSLVIGRQARVLSERVSKVGSVFEKMLSLGAFPRLNVCVLPKTHMLKANPHCDGIWKWGLWEIIR